jgi:hypothetical protein
MAKKSLTIEKPAFNKPMFIPKERDFLIMEAHIVDGFCNYTYEIMRGTGSGRPHSVKGPQIVTDDMLNAFATFNVHMAAIDDAFKYSNIDIEDIDHMHGHELTSFFIVSGFKITGGKDNESIQLLGNKYVSSCGGRQQIKTGKIPLDNLSSYKWYNELKQASLIAREEVALYEEGKYVIEEVDEDEKPNPNQTKIGFEAGQENEGNDEFEAARV